MRKKRTRTLSGNKGTILAGWGQALFRKCLVLFLIATCLAVSGAFFAAPGNAAVASTPVLVGYDIAPRTAYAGSIITFSYTINNQEATSQDVGLGATIRDPALNYINDPDGNEPVVSVIPGTATYTRTFRIPDTAMEGPYVVYWGIWSGVTGTDLYQLVWRNDYLNIVVAPTVTITIDDGYTNAYQNALPILNSYGYQATLFALTGLSEFGGSPLMSLAQMQSLKANGWEIASHTVDHSFLTSLTQEELQAELSDSKDWLVDNGFGPVYAIAYPYGDANGNVMATTGNYYKYARTIIPGINNYGPNLSLKAVMLWGNSDYNSLYDVEQVVTEAVNQNKWAIVLIHGVVTDPNDPKLNSSFGWVTTDVLEAFAQFLQGIEVPVKTFAQMEGGATPVNNPPVAVEDSYVTQLNSMLTVAAPGILGNDNDADGDPMTAAMVSGPSHGTANLNANGSLTYTPDTDYVGGDSFTYRANDTKTNSNTATVSITVTSDNVAPVAVDDAYSVVEDAVLTVTAPGVLGNDTDADADPLNAANLTSPAHGTLVFNANGSFTYTPASGYVGADSFTYQADDGTVNSNAATVTITVIDTGGSTSDTFGLDDGVHEWYEGSGVLDAQRFKNNAGTGMLTKLELLFRNNTPIGQVRLGVYADNNGSPGSLLLDAGEADTADGWASIDGLNLSVTGDAYYWLVFNLSLPNTVVDDVGSEGSHIWVNLAYGAFPTQFPSNIDGVSHFPYIMRATVTK